MFLLSTDFTDYTDSFGGAGGLGTGAISERGCLVDLLEANLRASVFGDKLLV